jgi:hypothetical protein
VSGLPSVQTRRTGTVEVSSLGGWIGHGEQPEWNGPLLGSRPESLLEHILHARERLRLRRSPQFEAPRSAPHPVQGVRFLGDDDGRGHPRVDGAGLSPHLNHALRCAEPEAMDRWAHSPEERRPSEKRTSPIVCTVQPVARPFEEASFCVPRPPT